MVFAEVLGDPCVHIGGRAGGFLAKEQVIAFLELCGPMRPLRFCGEEPEAVRSFGCEESIPAIVFVAFDHVPVVQAGAAEGFLRHIKADGVDDVQCAAGCCCGAADIAGVLGDLGVEQDDVKARAGHGVGL